MYSGYLAVSKFVLQKINSGVWFVQTFLRKMLYITKPPNFPYSSLAVNMWIMNQFHTYSQKKQNPAKKFIKSGQIKIARWRRHRAEARLSGKIERHGAIGVIWCDRCGAAIDNRHNAIVGLELEVRRRSLFFLSLCV